MNGPGDDEDDDEDEEGTWPSGPLKEYAKTNI
jgi:hypothetical protein